MKLAGARGITRSRVPLIAMMALAAIGIAGCEGDDGAQGPPGADGADSVVPGPTGPAGPTGPSAALEPREGCGVCHGDSAVYDVEVMHAVNPDYVVSGVAFAASTTDPTDLVVTFNVKKGTANFTTLTAMDRSYQFDGTLRNSLGAIDDTVPGDVLTPATLTGGTDGNYTVTIDGGVTQYGTVPSRYLFRLLTAVGGSGNRVIVVGDYPSSPDESLVSSAGCSGCHGNGGNGGVHYSFPFSGAACTVCHDATNTTLPRLFDIGHSVHNSHLMPSGEYVLETTDGADSWTYSATYPTYMTNCSVCHTASSGALAKVNTMPVSYAGCLSCHGSMESWEFDPAIAGLHAGVTEATNCSTCHTAGAARATVAEFHNGLETERVGIIYGGEDLSVTEGAKFNWKITEVVDDKAAGKLEISWTAEYPKGTPVNPCNTTVTATAPGFFNFTTFPANEGGMSMLRSYAQGDDYVLGQANAPGQASAVNVRAVESADANNPANTTCLTAAPFTATTIINRNDLPDGTRGIVALQGKPLLPVPAGMSTEHWNYSTMYVRVPTPTYEFVVGTGAKATERRVVADTEKCLGCHVGSLYQHGNTRVDNVTMCIICHNSASSDQNNRVVMGVTASEAYDGKVGQTYEFKTMLHAIHSQGSDLVHDPYVVYRTRGIYAWTAEDVTLPNWATGEACENTANTPPTPGIRVFGGDPAEPRSCQPHNLYHPTYPRNERDCAACHKAGFGTIPDQSKAVATTIDAGNIDSGTTNVWKNQLDDTLQGASAAACTSCHSSTDVRGHAYNEGWTPQIFPNGRQTILDTK